MSISSILYYLIFPFFLIASAFAQSNDALIQRLSNLPLEEKVQQIYLMNDNLIYLNKGQNNIDGKLPTEVLAQRKDFFPHYPILKKYDNFEKNGIKYKKWIEKYPNEYVSYVEIAQGYIYHNNKLR